MQKTQISVLLNLDWPEFSVELYDKHKIIHLLNYVEAKISIKILLFRFKIKHM
jgi:hypothetical protein